MYRPVHGAPQAWTANGATGSGSITLVTVTDTRVAGTFSFDASALMSSTTPQTYRVTRGTFDIRF
jgi:hypothetical protein